MDDKILLDKIVQRDENAFGILINKYMGMFYKIARRLLEDAATHEDITDCLSEAFIYIWLNINKYDPERFSLRNWCCLIVVARAKNQRIYITRQNRKIDRLQEHVIHGPCYVDSAEDVYIQNDSVEHILGEIDKLSEPSREIFKLRYLEGLKPRQISANLNISPKKVDNYLSYAKKKLRMEVITNEIE